ncbi:MAG TPA: MFS transporter [Thermoleophilaceae bacterium]|nr:MFS transporter [Thermoleophilaceae bacterium]
MRSVIELLRHERRARVFFAALAQSALGTGAAYVALLLVALDRFDSPWAIGLVLLADVVPAMLLGPLFGAFADRWSRRGCTVLADILRAVAFLGLVVVDGFVGTFLLALLAGVGTGLFTPAALAALPSLVEERRLPAATSLFGAIADFGFIAGPAIAAAVLLVGDPETILGANAVTFALSALALTMLRFGEAPPAGEREGPRPSLLRETRDGLVATAGMAGLRVILVASGAALLFGAIFNVGQPLLARDELGSSDAGFAVLVTAYGFGFIAGTLRGSQGGDVSALRRRYLTGAFLMALGFTASGLAPSVAAAVVTFLAAGYGNGMLLIYERLLIQALVPDELSGRIFGIRDAITAWAFALGFLAGPLLLDVVGTRAMVTIAGACGLLVWVITAVALRRSGLAAHPSVTLARGAGADLAWQRRPGEHGADAL